MARLLRSYGISSLGGPQVIGAGRAFYGPQTNTEVARRTANSLTRNTRRATVYHLKPPAVTDSPQAFVASPIEVRLAHNVTSRVRRTVDSRLRPGIVGPGITYGGPRVYLTQPPDYLRRRGTHYKLRGPIVGEAVSADIFAGAWTWLVPNTRPIPTTTRLSPPAVLASAAVYTGPKVYLTELTWRRRRRRSQVPGLLPVPPAFQPVGELFVYLTELTWRRRRRRPQIQGLQPVPPAFRPIGKVTTHLAYSRRGKTYSFIRGPVVVNAGVAYFAPQVTLAPSRRGAPKSHLAPPTVTQSAANFYGPKVALADSPSKKRRRRPLAGLLPVPTAFRPVGQLVVYLAYSRRGRPVSILPKVTYGAQIYEPIAGYLTPPRSTRPPVHSTLRRPTDVSDAQDIGVLKTHLAYSRRGVPKSTLYAPTVVGPVLARPIDTTFVRIRPVKTTTRLEPPVVVYLAVEIYGPELNLSYSRRGRPIYFLNPPTDLVDDADKGRVRIELAYSRRGKAKSLLGLPSPYAPQQKAEYQLATTFAYQSRGKPRSFLRAPVVVAAGIAYLLPLVALVRIRPARTMWELGRPVDVVDEADKGSVKTHLAYSRRGAPKSKLRPPAVVFVFYARSIDVTLTRIRPVAVHSILRRPSGADGRPFRGILTHLTYSKRGKPLSGLGRPVVLDQNDAYPQGPLVVYVPSATQARKARSRLAPPTVVQAFIARPIRVFLVRIKHPPVKYFLRKPTDLIDEADKGRVRVELAYSLRGKPKSILRAPTVIDIRPQVYYLGTWLAYSRRGRPLSFLRPDSKFAPQPQTRYTLMSHLAYSLRGKPKSKLRPPTVIRDAPFATPVIYQLAPQKRGKPKSTLRPPTVINNPSQVTYPAILLTYSRRGAPKSRLFPPAVIVYPEYFYGPSINLTYSLRGRPKSFLKPPTVVVYPATITYGIFVTLAYQSRGTAKSKLPEVIYAARVYDPIAVTLAPSTRGKPKSRLLPIPAAFRPVGELRVNLTYSRRGRPIYFLNPPTDVVDRADQGLIATSLAYSRRGKAKSKLPTVLYGARVYAPITTTLAPARRPQAKSFIVRAYVIKSRDVFRPIDVTLAPQRRGVAKPKLRQVIYAARVFAPISVNLAYSRRGIPKSFLHGVIYAARVYAPVEVVLAPSTRLARRPHSKLTPPVVVRYFTAPPITVHLTRIRPPKTIWRLRPPTVVNTPAAVEIYGPKVTLVRIRPVRTLTMLKPSIPPVCYGVVCGFDYSAEVIGSDSGASVIGGDVGVTVSGGDSAAIVTGATGSDATVSGGDERREGC